MRMMGPAGLLLLLIGGGTAFAQPTLLNADQALRNLYKQFGARLPACPGFSSLAVRDDLLWLNRRLKGTTVDSLYVASLADLGDAVRESARNANSQRACAALRLVAADLHVKRQDCRALGHSRTNIPVEVRTLAGGKEVAGWEVYLLWLPAGDRFTAVPKRLRGISSPARGTVPIPGEYVVYAKRPSSSVSTDPIRVSIGGTEVFTWPLPVPVAATSRSEEK